MGLIDKLLGRKQLGNNQSKSPEYHSKSITKDDTFISTGDEYAFKIIRSLSEEQRECINKSTLLLRASQLYTHYWTSNLVCTNREDPDWQNMVMFFWKAEEPFPKKSLPSQFESFIIKMFLFKGDNSAITFQVGQVMPWFGMPGLGEKHVCEINGQKVTIPELNRLGLVEYVQIIELSNDNLEILKNSEEYFFLIDFRITPFQNGNFHLRGNPIPIDVAYSIGGIHIIRKTELE